MEHDRITDLLRRTPPGLPEPRADADALLRRYRRRRARRLVASSVAFVVVAVGLVVPLALLANVVSGPSGSSGLAASGQAMPGTGRFTCDSSNVTAGPPRFAVQPDGPHFIVRNPGGATALVLLRLGQGGTFPIRLRRGGATSAVEPALGPRRYLARCEQAPAVATGTALVIRLVDPHGTWIDPGLECSSTRHTLVLSEATIRTRADVPAAVRDSVVGISGGDHITPAGYPENEQDITFVVRRDATIVATIHLIARRSLPVVGPGLDVTACDGTGIAVGQQVR
jgi:hypothetical protein